MAMDPNARDIKIQDTPEDIVKRRWQVLDRFDQFKSASRMRRGNLEDTRRLMYFKRDADGLESWINEKLQTACDENYRDPINLQNKIQKHQAFEGEVVAHSNTIESLDKTGWDMINNDHYASDSIKGSLDELHNRWELLRSKLQDKGKKLQQALQMIQYSRDCDEVMFWMNDKESFVTSKDFGQDLEGVEVLEKKFSEFEKDLQGHWDRVNDVNATADKLMLEDHPESKTISQKQNNMNEAWDRLNQLSAKRKERLYGAREIQNFNRKADDTIEWIAEKDAVLSTDDYGRDLPSVLALQRKHGEVERDVAAIDGKVKSLSSEADKLTDSHPDQRRDIGNKRKEIERNWKMLKGKAGDRKTRLGDSEQLQRFLSDYRDLISWIHDMKTLISADELAKDVAGAEALLERHQEHKGEIDSKKDTFTSTKAAGKKLIAAKHYASDEVKNKLVKLEKEKSGLHKLWEDRLAEYKQCLDLQLYYRDTEQANAWMTKQQVLLDNKDLGDSRDSVEALIKKHDDFTKSVDAHNEKIDELDNIATTLIEKKHYAAAEVNRRRDDMLKKREDLASKMNDRGQLLDESYQYQRFDGDCEETKSWITEKLKAVSEEGDLDTTNLQGKMKKHANFEAELRANKARIVDVNKTGEKLIDNNHYNKDNIRKKLNEIQRLWDLLNNLSKKKGEKLKEASDQQLFNRNIEDVEIWLTDIEGQLMSEDYGKDLPGVQNLQKKHALLEADVASRKDRIDDVSKTADKFVEDGHFNADNIKDKQERVCQRYDALHEPMADRRSKLADALKLQQYLRDVDDEEDWIREREPLAASNNIGRDLTGVQNLTKKHQALQAELDGHEGRIDNVCDQGEKMITDGHFASDEIDYRNKRLREKWGQLKNKGAQRGQNLEDSLKVQQYFTDANWAEGSMREKEPLAGSTDYGKDEDSAEALLKKQEALVTEIEAYSSAIDALGEQAQACKELNLPPVDGVGNENVLAMSDYTFDSPNGISVKKGDILSLLDDSDKDCWKVQLNERQGYVPAEYLKRIDGSPNIPDEQNISKRQKQLENQYDNLLDLGHDRRKKLEDSIKKYQLLREANELAQWISDKENAVRGTEVTVVDNLDQLQDMQKQLDDEQKDLKAKEAQVRELTTIAENLSKMGQTEAADKINDQIKELNKKCEELQKDSKERSEQLRKANEVKKYCKDADKTKSRLEKKTKAMQSADIGHDLSTVQRLKRKHENQERDMATLGEQVKALDETASSLKETYPNETKVISEHQNGVNDAWNLLAMEADTRKVKLDDSYDLQKFLRSSKDLTSWINSMISLVSSDKLANDVTGAEALIERHQEHRMEIDARGGSFQAFETSGNQLLQNNHYASADVQDKLRELAESRRQLEDAWMARRIKLDQCLETQLFNRDCDQALTWIKDREKSLKEKVDVANNVEGLLKKNEELERAMMFQADKIRDIDNQADCLIQNDVYDKKNVAKKRDKVLDRWAKLKNAVGKDRVDLVEAQSLQNLNRDVDQVEMWISEKLQFALDDAQLDPSNIKSKKQKHTAFEGELAANQRWIEKLIKMGEEVENNPNVPEEKKQEILGRIKTVVDDWEKLKETRKDKGGNIKDAEDQVKYIEDVRNTEFWLGEVEHMLSNDDCGKDLETVENLMAKHNLVDAEIKGNASRINDLNSHNIDNDICRADNIPEKLDDINTRYARVQALNADRKDRLEQAKTAHLFFRDVDDEEAWIKEKKLLVGSDDYGRDRKGVGNMRKKHKRLESELNGHEKAIKDVERRGDNLVADSNPKSDEIQDRVRNMCKSWTELKQMAGHRGEKLNESFVYQQLLDKVEEEESWMAEKEQLLSEDDYGDTMSAVQALLKKQDAFESDAEIHRYNCQDIMQEGDKLIAQGNHNETDIRMQCEALNDKMAALDDASRRRKARLNDQSAFLQFIWKTDVVETWIANKEAQVKLDDTGKDLSTVQTQLAYQATFDAGLEAFEKEGIQTITGLKDQLVASHHAQTPAIERRHNNLITRWKKLLADSAARKQRLLHLQEQYREVEDLYLNFAKEASRFNSFFENAEEDLTDPVHCNSVEEIKALREAYEVFTKSLSPARADFNQLLQLDKKIKSFNSGPNPYTWFTMEALEDSWQNMERILKGRGDELKQEQLRQDENEKLRKQFAKAANDFNNWIKATRSSMMEGKGNLESQLRDVKNKEAQINQRRKELTYLQDLDANMEQRYILDNKYTKQSTLSLAQQFDQLEQLRMNMEHDLERQIRASKQTVDKASYDNYKTVYSKFDQDKSGKLSHQQFKSCLRALGIELPPVEDGASDPEFERILAQVDPKSEGTVTFQDYMAYLIAKETANVTSADDVEQAFKSITSTQKDYITRKELYDNLTPEYADYCIQHMKPYKDPKTGRTMLDAYDYVEFTKAMFIK